MFSSRIFMHDPFEFMPCCEIFLEVFFWVRLSILFIHVSGLVETPGRPSYSFYTWWSSFRSSFCCSLAYKNNKKKKLNRKVICKTRWLLSVESAEEDSEVNNGWVKLGRSVAWHGVSLTKNVVEDVLIISASTPLRSRLQNLLYINPFVAMIALLSDTMRKKKCWK